MIGVNSLHSAGRLRSRSLCTVRYGRDFRMMDPFRYPRTPRSRSLKPLVFPDLLGKAQDGQNHPQARKRRKVLTRPSVRLSPALPLPAASAFSCSVVVRFRRGNLTTFHDTLLLPGWKKKQQGGGGDTFYFSFLSQNSSNWSESLL